MKEQKPWGRRSKGSAQGFCLASTRDHQVKRSGRKLKAKAVVRAMPDARARAKIMAVGFMAFPYFGLRCQNRPRTSGDRHHVLELFRAG
jgi:hypothetical protein